jgi:hypothetical protein
MPATVVAAREQRSNNSICVLAARASSVQGNKERAQS